MVAIPIVTIANTTLVIVVIVQVPMVRITNKLVTCNFSNSIGSYLNNIISLDSIHSTLSQGSSRRCQVCVRGYITVQDCTQGSCCEEAKSSNGGVDTACRIISSHSIS